MFFQTNFFMARTNHSFIGPIGDFSFYTYNGENHVRTKGGASKKTIANSPSCAAIAQSNVEFGGASQIGALLRRAIGPKLKYFADTHMIGNLVGVLKKMIQSESGVPGQRILDLGAYAGLLEGFEINTNRPFYSCFSSDLNIHVSEQCDAALLKVRFCTATDVLAPTGATSFQILHTLLCFPRYGLCTVMKKYIALDSELTYAHASSAMLFTDLSVPVNLKLLVKLPSAAAEHSTLLCVVGIAFYKGTELIKGVCGMGVVRVV